MTIEINYLVSTFNTITMLKGKFKNTYRKKGADGVVRQSYVYAIDGPTEELDAFIDAQNERLTNGAQYDDNGKPLMWSPRPLPETIDVFVSPQGAVIVQNDPFSEMESQIEATTNPSVKAALATLYAEQIINKKGAFAKLAVATNKSATANDDNSNEPEADNMESVLEIDAVETKPTSRKKTN